MAAALPIHSNAFRCDGKTYLICANVPEARQLGNNGVALASSNVLVVGGVAALGQCCGMRGWRGFAAAPAVH